MPSYGNQIAPRDQTQHISIRSLGVDENDRPRVLDEPIEVDFYVNRITGRSVKVDLNGRGEDMSVAEEMNYQNVADFCNLLARWDVTGPLYDAVTGAEIVPEHVVVPIDPDIVQHMNIIFRNAVTQAILGAVAPNTLTSPGSRRR